MGDDPAGRLGFQSTPPARGATHPNVGVAAPCVISIHAPREGGDADTVDALRRAASFQSTPPARGATLDAVQQRGGLLISIHAPREGGDPDDVLAIDYRLISIHAPREGGDFLIVNR